MITAEELATELGQIDPYNSKTKTGIAIAILPFVQSRAAGVQGAGDESARLAALWDSEAAKLERGGVNQPNYDKGLASGLRQCASNLRDSAARQSRLTTPQPPRGAGAVPSDSAQKARNRVNLWFFRDITDDQRIKLLKLFGFPANETGTHCTQIHGLRYIFDTLSTHPSPAHAGAGDAEWTDDQCREFARIAFRHARHNLPKNVELQDIRMGAEFARRLAGGDHGA